MFEFSSCLRWGGVMEGDKSGNVISDACAALDGNYFPDDSIWHLVIPIEVIYIGRISFTSSLSH